MARSRQAPSRPAPPPLETNDVGVAVAGTTAWIIALGVLMVLDLPREDRWWLWVCAVGIAIGLFAIGYVPRLQRNRARDAERHAERSRTPGTSGGSGRSVEQPAAPSEPGEPNESGQSAASGDTGTDETPDAAPAEPAEPGQSGADLEVDRVSKRCETPPTPRSADEGRCDQRWSR